ncbi:GDP-mannose 4,6-dehydratase [Leptospira sp. 2 VSF19]|uniref:GDP-mannose 4,6-dehydratase n=1 Tax=Leptospira soteropolitanensis TaxID=2950025 RepID=A0AAW5VI60_9LEPT|nr:GDP-mannose 4,6-dehydratase [Leptospira soteropolitanensis]MCW7491339.1 GDP-mannose 4,6-dehydratase [Leptospira soteropolitanensis]MCW7498924.1 GDP-mannose 4,6-dehydratase [Leptospira soteropolitanensis]MCW7521484.1 GDP-mannose 4,6-dehydratase [Leptospira soteropolitanensis]MCW7525027.1 GDP-mannose 4,6-dehydratase [Leptospira soteropolitanensis]MCW7528895.1 GDP-mannose 4,6-dehydratase [Leptospira soteropolitanensis]
MKKKQTLVTGASGFVGSYLLPALESQGDSQIYCFQGDIRDRNTVTNQFEKIKPDILVHLAAQAFVPMAIDNPWETEEINVGGTLNLLESLHRMQRPCKMLYISSADVYGKQNISSLPLKETLLPNPVNPYAGSKLAAESYCRQYAQYSPFVSVVIARPFNHIGIGQRKEFVIPNFCSQIIEAKHSGKTTIAVGDLEPTRDFSHVEDIVSGYLTLIEKGESGEIYNICSGEERSIRYMVEELVKISGHKIKFEVDSGRVRASETSKVYGDNSKLKALGWRNKHSLSETLLQIYNYLESEFLKSKQTD